MVIYTFKNKTNGMMYVGQTTQPLRMRTMQHMRARQTYFDKALNKYGLDSFDIEVVDRAETPEELNEKEILWIERLGTLKPNGYNLCLGGNSTSGYNHSEESKMKMSATKKAIKSMQGEKNHYYGKKHTEEIKAKMKEAWKSEERLAKLKEQNKNLDRTYQQKKVLNVDTEEVFNSIKEAAARYDLKETHISRVCRGKRKTTGGFRWSYVY